MSSYGLFAEIYDRLINEDIDYEAICDFSLKYINKQAKTPPIVLDLGCGTGTLTKIMADKGCDMIGVDLSDSMLNIARRKDENSLYLCQDMRSFELYGTVDAIVCATDCINYITSSADLLKVFKLAKNYLNPDAPFIFDINASYKLKNYIANNTFTYDDDDVFYVWENEMDEKSGVTDFYLTFFVKNGSAYERFDEVHSEKAYEEDEIKSLLSKAGFCDINVYDGYSKNEINPQSMRLVFVAK